MSIKKAIIESTARDYDMDIEDVEYIYDNYYDEYYEKLEEFIKNRSSGNQ